MIQGEKQPRRFPHPQQDQPEASVDLISRIFYFFLEANCCARPICSVRLRGRRALAARFTPAVRRDVMRLPSALPISKLFLTRLRCVRRSARDATASSADAPPLHAPSFSPGLSAPPPAPMSKPLPQYRARPSRARMAAAHTAPCLASEPWSLRARHCHSRRTDREEPQCAAGRARDRGR